jgi:uncharacterized protein (UPF0297 family)
LGRKYLGIPERRLYCRVDRQVREVESMSEWPDETMLFRVEKDQTNVGRVLREVYRALEEKGYDPVNQIVGYLISGDPTYITSHRNARGLMRSVERDEVIEELVRLYLKTLTSPNP